MFLGLGTGLGSCMILDNVIAPMELGHLPYKKGRSFEEYVGNAGMKRMGRRKWQFALVDVIARLRAALAFAVGSAAVCEVGTAGAGEAGRVMAAVPGDRVVPPRAVAPFAGRPGQGRRAGR